jgi:hypothetical protein
LKGAADRCNIAKLPSVPRQILKDSEAAELGQPGRLSAAV